MAIGKLEARIIATPSLRLCGQVSMLPSAVKDQSISRIRRAISPGGFAGIKLFIVEAAEVR